MGRGYGRRVALRLRRERAVLILILGLDNLWASAVVYMVYSKCFLPVS